MSQIELTIDGEKVQVPEGTTILEAAKSIGIYIPALCYHPDLPSAKGVEPVKVIYQGNVTVSNSMPDEKGKGCGLCVVEVNGEAELVGSCGTPVEPGMVVITDNERVRAFRRKRLISILKRHPHACLICSQQEGCSRTQCSSNVPENERCCELFGRCELQKVAEYIGIPLETPKWVPTGLPVLSDPPLFTRDYNLCIGCTRCVRMCKDVLGIGAIGFVYDKNGDIQVGSIAPTLAESGCKFCTACVEVCPTGALLDKGVTTGKKEDDLVRCQASCPVHIDVPGYLRFIAQGHRDQAEAVIREKVPFPGVLGRVCIRPCEEVCRRGDVNEPIAICALKRYAVSGSGEPWDRAISVKNDTGKRVAVIGAGPAGLTAGFYLRAKGHRVTIFEAEQEPGGMMRYGIPEYRLPRQVLNKEIQDVLSLGIDLRLNQVMGRDFTLEELRGAGYDAIFLATGAQQSKKILLEEEQLEDVLWGLEFLKDVNHGRPVKLKKKVVVIGGGNVAVDVARTAIRCGAGSVVMVCLEARDQMPVHHWELEDALVEGVKLMNGWGPQKIISYNGLVASVKLMKCIRVFDNGGQFAPVFDEAETTELEADQIIISVGQRPDLSFLGINAEVMVKNGLVTVDPDTLQTTMQGVYAGGDITTGPASIIHAIAAGRKVASSIDRQLGGDGNIDQMPLDRIPPGRFLGRDEGFAMWPREQIPQLEVKKRITSFKEVCLGYGKDQAVREAKRCLQCDLRLSIASNPSPPEKVMVLTEENILKVPDAEGVIQLYDSEKNVIMIKGTPNLRKELLLVSKEFDNARWFHFEEDKMFSKRESELIQRYVQEHGSMPGEEDLDDLF